MCHIHKRDFDTLMLQALCYASIKVLYLSQLMFFYRKPQKPSCWCLVYGGNHAIAI